MASRLEAAVEEPIESAEMKAEKEHFKAVVNSFLYYKPYAEIRLKQVRGRFDRLPLPHREMLPGYLEHCEDVWAAVDRNWEFVKALTKSSVGIFENSDISKDSCSSRVTVTRASNFHMDKVLTTIKQFFRDWSKPGAKERDMCYKPIVDEILTLFPCDMCDKKKVSILVPGAGLGRLAFEIAQCGYSCQGNEFSFFMLLGSNFIINQSEGVNAYSICPWVHQYSNLTSYDHQTEVVYVPDVNPADSLSLCDFSMAAGDFLEVYVEPEQWDCVACCFFMDTAHNIIQYLERIYHILKPGGYWISFGPLLYHFADMPHEFSIELSWEEVRRIAVEHIGFEVLKELRDQPSSYIQNPHSMINMQYRSVFVVARKPVGATTAARGNKEGGGVASTAEEATTANCNSSSQQDSKS